MSTILLTCTNCGVDFEKTKAEYQRRLAKMPDSANFFCTRSCVAKYHNRTSPTGSKNQHPQFHGTKGNAFGQKHDKYLSWYIQRCSNDRRFARLVLEDKQALGDAMARQWEIQDGRCVYTGVLLSRRLYDGSCGERNPFYVASLDRIDNSKSYTVGNIQWVSLAMNLARNKIPDCEFREYVEVVTVINKKTQHPGDQSW